MMDHTIFCHFTPLEQSTTHNVNFDNSLTIVNGKPNEITLLGGAGNIAYCCTEFFSVELLGIVGNDSYGREIREFKDLSDDPRPFPLSLENIIPVDNYVSIAKIYYHADRDPRKNDDKERNYIIRINRELDELKGEEKIKPEIMLKLVKTFRNLILDENIGCVIFKDHQKGFISKNFLKEISPYVNARKKRDMNFLIFVDPKYDWEKFSVFNEIDAIFPNIKEAAAGIYPTYPNNKDKNYENKRKNLWKDRMQERELTPGEWSYLLKKYPHIKKFIVKVDEKGAYCLFYSKEKTKGHDKGIYLASVPRFRKSYTGNTAEIGCGDVFAAYYIKAMMTAKEQKIDDTSIENNKKFLFLANAAAGIKLGIDKSRAVDKKSVRTRLSTKTDSA